MTRETVERLCAEVLRLVGVECDLSLERAAVLAELELTQPGTGDPTPEAQVKVLAKRDRLQGKVASIEAAITASRTARRTAIAERHFADAADLRSEAETLRGRAAERTVVTDELLAKLAEHEGVQYVPGPKPEYVDEGLTKGLVVSLRYGIDAAETITAGLQRQAAEADEKAAKLQGALVPMAGAVMGAGVTALFEAVLADPYRIGPTMQEIDEWFSGKLPAEIKQWTRARASAHLPARPEDFEGSGWRVRCTLVWRAGTIRQEESTITLVPAPVRRKPAKSPMETAMAIAATNSYARDAMLQAEAAAGDS